MPSEFAEGVDVAGLFEGVEEYDKGVELPCWTSSDEVPFIPNLPVLDSEPCAASLVPESVYSLSFLNLVQEVADMPDHVQNESSSSSSDSSDSSTQVVGNRDGAGCSNEHGCADSGGNPEGRALVTTPVRGTVRQVLDTTHSVSELNQWTEGDLIEAFRSRPGLCRRICYELGDFLVPRTCMPTIDERGEYVVKDKGRFTPCRAAGDSNSSYTMKISREMYWRVMECGKEMRLDSHWAKGTLLDGMLRRFFAREDAARELSAQVVGTSSVRGARDIVPLRKANPKAADASRRVEFCAGFLPYVVKLPDPGSTKEYPPPVEWKDSTYLPELSSTSAKNLGLLVSLLLNYSLILTTVP